MVERGKNRPTPARERDPKPSGWDSLTQLNPDSSPITWDDLAEGPKKIREPQEEPKEDVQQVDESEQIELVKLTNAETRKLPSYERIIYYTNPSSYAQLQKLKENYDKSLNFQAFTEQLASYIEYQSTLPKHSPSPEKPIRPTHELDQIAHIYDAIGYKATFIDLFEKSPSELDQISHYFDISLSELPLEKELPVPRESLIKNIISKLHLGQRENSQLTRIKQQNNHINQRNRSRISFLSAIASRHNFDGIEDDSLRDLAKITENSIEADDFEFVDLIYDQVNHEDTHTTLSLATTLRELGKNRLKQRSATSLYYSHFAMDDQNIQKFHDQILPLLFDSETCEERMQILVDIPNDDSPEEQILKQDFAIEKLLPNITIDDKDTWRPHQHVYRRLLKNHFDHDKYETVYQDIENQIVPFAASHYSGVRSFLAIEMVDLRFNQLENHRGSTSQPEKSPHQKDLTWYIEQSNELLSDVETDTRGDQLLKDDLIKLAFERDYEPKFTEYLKTDLFPKIVQNDPSLGSWVRGAGFLRGESKIRNFDFNCLTSKITPHDINQLLIQRRELPTSDANRLEQNRIDALAIEGVVVPNHSFIHYEDPLAHSLLTAMVNYYDTYETADSPKAKQELDDIAKECSSSAYGIYGQLDGHIYDINNYNEVIKGEVNDDSRFSRTYDTPAIDVLRRLAENTKPDNLEIPDIADEKWRKLMQDAEIRPNPEANGKMHTDWNGVGKLIKYTNNWLIEHQDQYGLDASMLAAIGFAERAATFALRNASERERKELPYDDNFKEIVKLQELTASYDRFHAQDFEHFWEGFKNVKLDDEKTLQDHYWRLAKRELTQAAKLQRAYEKEGKNDAGMILQSGNLLAELVQLIDHREPKTLRERVDRSIN